jgi:TRAP-type C4-dicarboxylate transport system permease small subunit
MQTKQTSSSAGALVWFDKWLSKVENGFTLIAAVAIFVLMILGVWQVIGRTVFGLPVRGYIDMVELSMATFTFMGIAYCQRLGGHVRMDLFVRMVHGRARWLLEFITSLLPLALVGTLIFFSWEHFVRAYNSGDSTIDMEYPVWPSKLIVPLSFSLLFLRISIQTIGYWRLLIWPKSEPLFVPLILTEKELAEKEIEDSKGGVSHG